MGYVYIALNLECWKCARTRFSLRKLSGGTAQLRALEGTLLITASEQFATAK